MKMMMLGMCRPVRDAWNLASERCNRSFHCFADSDRRTNWGLKFSLVAVHLIFVGALFLFDVDLIQNTKKEPWYTAAYLLLFVATLVQYLFTSGSSPGYAIDAMRATNDSQAIFTKKSTPSKQPALSKNRGLPISVEASNMGRTIPGMANTPWTKLVMEMYPPGSNIRSLTCSYCNIVQPPRTKHCYDCEKCVLQFDHHCVWLGTCIGQKNHCRFWWFIFEETILCIWTGVFYISYLRSNFTRGWWKDAIIIFFLAILSICLVFLLLLLLFHSYLILTNQTTYELVRRRRISYLRSVPERVYPFSKGICRNVYNFCCDCSGMYSMERLPSAQELEARSRPYTCCDVLSCRCC
ncbi:hypothetical protein Sjap_009809 [Stephania japonica]|uniref:S-acyltransferase n=1 Tax=Stephania japonica TaxID=461633 RepID=A0AAP0P336_9MAGN